METLIIIRQNYGIGKQRFLLKIAFFRKYKYLAKASFEFNRAGKWRDCKLPNARMLIEKARTEVGYSRTTNDVDVFLSLRKVYYECQRMNLLTPNK